MGEMMSDQDGLVRITIPLEISVRLAPASGAKTAVTPAVERDAENPGALVGAGTAAVPAVVPARPVTRPKLRRNRAALQEGPLTFKDHFVSLYQSAVSEVASKIAKDK